MEQLNRFPSSAETTSGVVRISESIAVALAWLFLFAIPWEDEVALPGGWALNHIVGFLAFGMTTVSILASGRIRKPGTVHYVLMAWTGWAALSYTWSLFPEGTAERTVTYLELLGMVLMIRQLAPDKRRQLMLLNAYVFGTVVSAISTISAFLNGNSLEKAAIHGQSPAAVTEARYVAEGLNANVLGIIMALSIPLTCYLLSQRSKSVPGLLYWIQLLLAATTILLTGSRGALLAAGVGMLMFPLIVRTLPSWHRVVVFVMVPLIIIAAIAIVPKPVLERFTTIGSEVAEGTLTKRTLIWGAGLQVFREHPLLGVGSGAFGASVLSRLDIAYAAHNTFLSVLVEQGVPGALLFATLLGVLIYGAFMLPGKLQSGLWITVLATWMVGVFSTTWEYGKPTWCLFGILAAQIATHETGLRRLNCNARV